MMNDPRQLGQPRAWEGLCPRCENVQIITNDRGSRFYLCRLSSRDPRFHRYPAQPVLACSGFQPALNSSN